MNEDLLNVFGSFAEVSLDCIEKQNEEIEQLEKRIENAIDRLEALIIFWKKYNPVDNTMQVEQFKGVIGILKGDNKED